MSWAAPHWLWASLIISLIIPIAIFSTRAHRARVRAAFGPQLSEQVLPRSVRTRRTIRDVAALIGLLLMVVAVAEPRFGKEIIEINKRGVDLILLIDLSYSMNAQDVKPSRLERARREVRDLIEVLEGDRVGMVIYAGGAYPRMPLTHDHDALGLLVQEIDTQTFAAQGSNLAEAIRVGLKLLDDPSSPADKAMIILSDGEVHQIDETLAAAKEARDAHVKLFSVGIGEEAAPVLKPDGTWQKWQGKTVLSAPSPQLLKDLAKLTGGAYVKSVASNSDITQLYRSIRKNLKAGETGTVQREVWRSAFQWPLGLALILWLSGSWLGDGRRRQRLAVLLLLPLLHSAPAHAGTLADADAAYRDGRFSESTRLLSELSQEDPNNPDIYERLGASRYRQGDFEGATRAWEFQAMINGESNPKNAFNLGNASYKSGRIEEAIAHYDEVLSRFPEHKAATANRERALKELEARRQIKPPQEQPKEGQDGKSPESEGDDEKNQSPGEGDEQQGDGQGKSSGDEQPQESDGEPSDEGESGQQSDASEGAQGSDETSGEDETSSGGVSPDELDDNGDQPAEGAQGANDGSGGDNSEGEGGMSEAQAERLLDGVKEGRPQVYIPGNPGEKPW